MKPTKFMQKIGEKYAPVGMIPAMTGHGVATALLHLLSTTTEVTVLSPKVYHHLFKREGFGGVLSTKERFARNTKGLDTDNIILVLFCHRPYQDFHVVYKRRPDERKRH